MTMPRTRNTVIIRPACAPYDEGFFLQFCLTSHETARLRAHPLLAAILPQASWVGCTSTSPDLPTDRDGCQAWQF